MITPTPTHTPRQMSCPGEPVGSPAGAGPSARYLLLQQACLEDQEKMMLRGERPDLEALAEHEYRGFNYTPIAPLLGIRKFIKGFVRQDGPAGPSYSGYNLPTQQNEPSAEWHGKPDDARARRFGFYAALPVDARSRDNVYLNAVLLDYGKGPNPALDPSRTLRDYLVRVDPGSDLLLCGKAYLALGPARVPVGCFLLERLR